MSRFFIIVSLLLNIYLVWCAAGVFVTMAHSGSEILFPVEGLERYQGDKNSRQFIKEVQSAKAYLLEHNDRRGRTYDSYAIKIACVAVFQFFVTVGLVAARAFKKPARKDVAGSPVPPRS